MKKNKYQKWVYVKPEVRVVIVETDCHLLETSVSGGHHSADDDEVLNAKKAGFFGDEDEFVTDKTWED
ncbi:MAG: hypothetical protein SOV83_02330 [Prevotella sp.]|nr:hypothetical protein [Prevotella sp.]